MVNGYQVDFLLFDATGRISADVMSTDAAQPSGIELVCHGARWISEGAKHVLNGGNTAVLWYL